MSGILIPYKRTISRPLKTDQTISYATGDDGDLELGVPKSYSIYTLDQYAGTTNITINGKTCALSNNCVQSNRTGLMWARYVPVTNIGPGADGKLFWEQWTLANKTDISFTAGTKTINSGASQFNTGALCSGRIFTVSGSTSNNGTYTVSTISTANIVTVEALIDESAGATVTIATVDDLIWNFSAQANANALGGYTDWRIPNFNELTSIMNIGRCSPIIDVEVFPSTPSNSHWTASTYSYNTLNAFYLYFGNGIVGGANKQGNPYYVRLCRGGIT